MRFLMKAEHLSTHFCVLSVFYSRIEPQNNVIPPQDISLRWDYFLELKPFLSNIQKLSNELLGLFYGDVGKCRELFLSKSELLNKVGDKCYRILYAQKGRVYTKVIGIC